MVKVIPHKDPLSLFISLLSSENFETEDNGNIDNKNDSQNKIN